MTNKARAIEAARIEKEKRDARKRAEAEKRRRAGVVEATINPAEWIRRNITIEDPQAVNRGEPTIFKFDLWKEQEDVLNKIIQNKQVVILKSRQLGISWLLWAYVLYLCIFNENTNILVISKGVPEAKEVIRRIKGMFHRLDFKPVESSEPWNTREIAFSNNSRIAVLAPRPGAGASFTATFVVADEFALAPFADAMYSALKPTIDDGGKIVILSTAEEDGEIFEDIYQNAEKGENSFVPIFLPWHVRPSRTQEWYEKAYHEATNKKRFKQQYPSTADEAFAVVGENIFTNEEDWGDCLDATLAGEITKWECDNGCEVITWKSHAITKSMKVVWALDGSVSSDTTVLLGVTFHPTNPDKYAIIYVSIYKPTEKTPVHFVSLKDEVKAAWAMVDSQILVYDIYQLADMGQKIASEGIKTEVFQQQNKRWESDTLLRTMITTRNVFHGAFEELDEHVFNANAKVDVNQRVRIVKKKKTLKVDALVTLSMALYKMVEISTALRAVQRTTQMEVAYEGKRIIEVAQITDLGISADPARGLIFSGLPPALGRG